MERKRRNPARSLMEIMKSNGATFDETGSDGFTSFEITNEDGTKERVDGKEGLMTRFCKYISE